MKIFLDDIRIPSYAINGYDEKEWTLVKTYIEALKLIETGEVTHISFDHDLGTEKTGYDLAKKIEELVFYKKIKCPIYYIHSANPAGRENIKKAMQKAENFQ